MPNRNIQKLFQAYKPQLDRSPQPLKNRKAISDISYCRTEELGYSVYRCNDDDETVNCFHSCRNRSCHVCADKSRRDWVEKQKAKLLDVPHFHVIFTIAHEYLGYWRYNEVLFSRILFESSKETLLELMGDHKYGGFVPGILMALHTWGRNLSLHPHTHCLVTAGGLTSDGQWHGLGEFFAPGKVLRTVFRGKFQSKLKDALSRGDIAHPVGMTDLDFWALYRKAFQKDWNVRVEERYEHGKGVVLYLAKYCKGGALHPEQIQETGPGRMEMRYLDHRTHQTKSLHATPKELIRRILEHVPAKGFHTIRAYGLYAAAAKKKYARCVAELGTLAGKKEHFSQIIYEALICCKRCGQPMRRRFSVWPKRGRKEISINKESARIDHRLYVQQVDEAVKAKAGLLNSS